MTVTVNHAKTNAISDWTQTQLDEQIALGNFAPGTTLANIVLPSDWNDDHTLTGLGTMAEQNANSVAITGGTATLSSVTTPSVTATTTDLTLSAISTGAVKFNTLGGLQAQINDATTAGQYTLLARSNGLNEQQVIANGTANLGLVATGGGVINFWTATSGEKQFTVSRTVSAVNTIQVTGSATGTRPSLTVAGSDATIGLSIAAKGGEIVFLNNGVGTNAQFSTTFTAASVNYLTATGSGVSGNAPRLYAQGTDTNISMAFQPKGTGAIDLAAGSSGVNISNGGTVTAITRTAGGSGYATAPTVAISAPTTAGGVQATATCTVTAGAVNTTFTITNAGSGYIEQPTITFSGGGGSGATAYATVGSATTVKSLNGTMSFNTPAGESVRINNGGFSTLTDYVELRGGASVSGAYVTVGGSTANASLYLSSKASSNIQFYTNSFNQEQFRVSHTASAVNYVQVTGAATTGRPVIQVAGSDTNIGITYTAKGTGIHAFGNGNGTQLVLQAGSTSSVNRIEITPTVTGSAPILSAGGTDTNIDLALTPKGTGLVRFGTYVAGALLATGYINIKAADGTTYKVLVST